MTELHSPCIVTTAAEVQLESTLHNVINVGKVPYVAAKVHSSTLYQTIVLHIELCLKIVVISIVSVPWIIKDLLHVLVPRSRKNVSGQTALVTGAGNGIGRQIALRLAREGCNIAVADLDMKAAEETVQECRRLNVEAFAFSCDVAKSTEVRKLHQTIKSKMGASVDILVNNVGIMTLQSLREGSDEDIDRITKLNMTSHIYTLRTFLPDMIAQRRGHVIGISSMSGLHPTPGCALYSATKFALFGLNESMRAELRQEGLGDCIHFTTVHPYFVSTRQDVMDAVRLRYPPVLPSVVADETVVAMLSNVNVISVPRIMFSLATVFRLFPEKMQGFVRDYLLLEDEVIVDKFNGKLYRGVN